MKASELDKRFDNGEDISKYLDLSKARRSFLDSVSMGISDAEGGRTYSTEEIKKSLAARRSKWK